MRPTSTFLSLLTALLFSAAQASAAIIYVDAAAPAGGNGSSWQSAFNDLTDAIGASFPGDEIRIAGGIYKPGRGSSSRTSRFTASHNLTIDGAYAGLSNPSNPNIRSQQIYKTILSGDIGAIGTSTDNTYSVVEINSPSGQVRLAMLTITGGYGNGSGSNTWGGGLRLTRGNVYINEIEFLNNFVTNDGGAINYGSNAGSLEIVNSRFERNSSNLGGAIFSSNSSSGLISIHDSEFKNNFAKSNGGAVRVSSATLVVTIRNSTFDSNIAGDDGGAVYSVGDNQANTLLIDGSSFSNNIAHSFGAGTRGGGALMLIQGLFEVKNSVFSDNTSSSYGGGISTFGATGSIGNVRIYNNTANTAGGGLAVQLGGVEMVNSIVANNRLSALSVGGPGIGVISGNTPFRLFNCSIVSNISPSANAGGILSYSANAQVFNSVIWGNSSANSANDSLEGPISVNASLSPTAADRASGLAYELDHLFVDPVSGDFRPLVGSPLVNTGSNSLLPSDFLDLNNNGNTTEPLPVDITGAPRIQGGTVNIGAYEGAFEPGSSGGGGQCLADQDGDGAVTVADYFSFLNNFFSELGSPQCGG